MTSDSSGQMQSDGIRINELSRELGLKAKLVLDYLPQIGITEKKTHSSWISSAAAEKLRKHFRAPAEKQPTVTSISPARRPEDFVPLTAAIRAAPRARSGAATTETIVVKLPRRFTFHRDFVDFDYVLDYFNWSLEDVSVLVDLTSCESSNYQALAMLIQHVWFLTANGCRVTFKYGLASSGPTKMLNDMGAIEWLQVLTTDGKHFGSRPGRTIALRRRSDVQNTINIARRAIRNYSVGFPDYLSYIVSELLYNATEHGSKHALVHECHVAIPAIFQFGRYPASERLSFFFSDLGVGIKAHLERAYPPFPTHQDAIVHALRPGVSGTFTRQPSPYAVNNNAGMGLTYSSGMLKHLKGDMHIVSHNGLAHISPEDVTTRSLKHAWPGTFVLINLNISNVPPVGLEDLLAEIRGKAESELTEAEKQEQANKYYVNIENYFGKYAEDKDAAINFRDRHLIPAILDGKKIDLDFRGVETVPHSFLNALLATPVQRLGMKAYQWIRVYNAVGSIHEIIRTIFETNLPEFK